MFDCSFSLEDLFEGNSARQKDLYDIFKRMKQGFPEKTDLTILYQSAAECVFQGEALLGAIKDVFLTASRPPSQDLIPRMILEAALLPGQIDMDKKLLAYLQSEYSFLHHSPA